MAHDDSSVVVLTGAHTIAGMLPLRGQRLSDFLNDRRETVLRLRDVTLTRLEQPSQVIARDRSSVIHNDHVLIAFDAAPAAAASERRAYAFTLKQAHPVHLLLERIEVRGVMHTSGNLDVYDLHRLVATSGERFVPVTQATVSVVRLHFKKAPGVIVSVQHIHYIAKVESNP